MSFTTSPKGGSPGTPGNGQPSARDRAIAKLTAQPPAAATPPAESLEAALPAPQEEPIEGQPDTTEGVAASEAPKDEAKSLETKEESPLSTQYAILARKEKALRAKVQAQETSIKAREADIARREAELKAKDSDYSTNYIPKSRLLEDTWGVLSEAGLSYDELTQSVLNQPQMDPATKAYLQKMEDRIKAQEEQLKQSKQSQEEQQTKAYKQAVAQIRTEAQDLVSSDPAFETIKETNSVADVVDLIEQTFKNDGILLSTEEACKEVEEYLVEEAMKVARIKKIQQRLSPAQKEAPKPTEALSSSSPKQQPAMKTLTNSVGGSRQLSRRDKAIMAFKGEKF